MNNRITLLIFILSSFATGLSSSGQRPTNEHSDTEGDGDNGNIVVIETHETIGGNTGNNDPYVTDSDGAISPTPSEYDGSFGLMTPASSDEEDVVPASDIEDDGTGRFGYASSSEGSVYRNVLENFPLTPPFSDEESDEQDDVPGTPPPAVRIHRTTNSGANNTGASTSGPGPRIRYVPTGPIMWCAPTRVDNYGNVSPPHICEYTSGALTNEAAITTAIGYLNHALELLANDPGSEQHRITRAVIEDLAMRIEAASRSPLDQQLVDFARQVLDASALKPQEDSEEEYEGILDRSSSDEDAGGRVSDGESLANELDNMDIDDQE